MMDHPHATFRADLPQGDPNEPGGRPIAEALHHALLSQGLPAAEPDSWRDAGWSIACPIGGQATYLFFASMDDPERPWLLCCTSDVGLWARLVRREDHRPQRLELARAVHRALAGDPRFSAIRWYPRPDFRPGAPWMPAPE